MYHLVVLEGSFSQNQVSCEYGRFLEYTSEANIEKFKDLTDLELLEYPAIFMGEGYDDEPARIGKLIKISKVGREVKAYYVVDPDLPALTNRQIYDLSEELDIASFEFSRNHWALKDVDLFEVLLRAGVRQPFQPSVFRLSRNPVKSDLISVMMPFDASSDKVYANLKRAIEGEGLRCNRADDIWKNSHIMEDVIELICTARVVVCDLSGMNANVFYETGIAHSLGKEVILITQSMEHVPFDLRSLRCVTYLNNGEGREELAKKVVARVRDLIG
ncbi:hypothetical protein SAMN04488515_3558 [Cognatiyoonia koreensis]|uniref:Nucleoside 2-deoxyribosyltransferase n=1 Tax=Cognatiyoonia koreensis TaxID=364200 RepID=A0A1I0RZX8_9RHOB|nr:hypothetical protein [Cognatiyoonia koreensis]SEW47226.1 hypothetical protein SAMN04488515_3558 [Cognatiyoonia koreensis]